MNLMNGSYQRRPSTDTAEAARVQAIEHFAATSAVPGYRHIIDAAIADGRSQPADVAHAILQQIRSEQAAATGAPPDAAARAGSGGFPDLEAVQAAALQTWRSNAAIRAEFGGHQESYLAYRKAEALGQVRVTGPRRA